jgi:hypothetical protein
MASLSYLAPAPSPLKASRYLSLSSRCVYSKHVKPKTPIGPWVYRGQREGLLWIYVLYIEESAITEHSWETKADSEWVQSPENSPPPLTACWRQSHAYCLGAGNNFIEETGNGKTYSWKSSEKTSFVNVFLQFYIFTFEKLNNGLKHKKHKLVEI